MHTVETFGRANEVWFKMIFFLSYRFLFNPVNNNEQVEAETLAGNHFPCSSCLSASEGLKFSAHHTDSHSAPSWCTHFNVEQYKTLQHRIWMVTSTSTQLWLMTSSDTEHCTEHPVRQKTLCYLIANSNKLHIVRGCLCQRCLTLCSAKYFKIFVLFLYFRNVDTTNQFASTKHSIIRTVINCVCSRWLWLNHFN